MIKKNTFCAVPFVEAFTSNKNGFRNCCAASPQIYAENNATFTEWWYGTQMQQFRAEFGNSELPDACVACKIKEKTGQDSLRISTNKQVGPVDTDNIMLPSRWSVMFGNTCNLACWTCNESNSSVIETDKRKINILPKEFVVPNDKFMQQWDSLRENILNSYQHHSVVTLVAAGGEPMVNSTVLLFFEELIQKGLAPRTRLEMHTNGTKLNKKILGLLDKRNWHYICIFVSIDAVDNKAAWLRYGSDWETIKSNTLELKNYTNYLEVHCTISILNINDVENVFDFCKHNNLEFRTNSVIHPEMMSLSAWDGGPDIVHPNNRLESLGLGEFCNIIGSRPISGTKQQLKEYILQFSQRSPLREVDSYLANILDL